MEPQARLAIPVDYSLKLEPVYTNVILAIISTQRNLDILLYAGIGKTPSSEPEYFSSVEMHERHFPTNLSQQDLQRYILDSPGDGQDKAPDGADFETLFRRPRWVGQDEAPDDVNYETLFRRPCWLLLEGDRVGPSPSTIDFNIVSPTDYFQEAFELENMSYVIQTPHPAFRDLLPRVRIRAHYIDCVNETHDLPPIRNYLDQVRDDYDISDPGFSWMRPYFDLGGEPNYTDLINFLDMAYRGRSRYHPISRMEHKLFSGD
jgi:hypothetical protein